MILCDGDGWSGDGMFVWLRTDFPTKRVHPIPYTKWVNYSTDSLLEARITLRVRVPHIHIGDNLAQIKAMRLLNVQTFGSQCFASKQSKKEIWLRRSQIYWGAQIEKWSFCMCSCVISQRNHDFKILRWFCFACEGKPFTHRPMRSCVAAYFLKKSQPNGH